jgi:hypothetical protein
MGIFTHVIASVGKHIAGCCGRGGRNLRDRGGMKGIILAGGTGTRL